MVVEDGRYTGEIEFYAYGADKAEAMRELAESEGYDLAASYAYSDSVTDLPMLEAVGHPFAVNPDKALRKVAVERGWPVLSFADRSRSAGGFPAPTRHPIRRRRPPRWSVLLPVPSSGTSGGGPGLPADLRHAVVGSLITR